jgi:hypothetical protein
MSHAVPCRKQQLVRYLHRSKQRLIRLHTLVAWSEHKKATAAITCLSDTGAIGVSYAHLQQISGAADELYRANAELPRQHATAFPVDVALEVLSTGDRRLHTSLRACCSSKNPLPRADQLQRMPSSSAHTAPCAVHGACLHCWHGRPVRLPALC